MLPPTRAARAGGLNSKPGLESLSLHTMQNFLSRLASPTALLYIYLIFTQIAYGIYLARGIDPPPAFTLIFAAGLLWIVGWWLLKDSRKRDIPWIYDLGFFLTLAWPFVIPYYLLQTRRAKGLLLILAVLGTCIAAQLVGLTIYILVAPTSEVR